MMTRKGWIVGLAATAIAVGGVAGCLLERAHAADSETVVAAGGAPFRVLLDNASLRVTFISYPAGFHRDGAGLRRPYDTLIAYLDPGAFKSAPRSGARRGARANPTSVGQPAACKPVGDCGPVGPDGNYESQTASGQPLAVGSIAWHPKGSMVPTVEDTQAFRVLYIEFKR